MHAAMRHAPGPTHVATASRSCPRHAAYVLASSSSMDTGSSGRMGAPGALPVLPACAAGASALGCELLLGAAAPAPAGAAGEAGSAGAAAVVAAVVAAVAEVVVAGGAGLDEGDGAGDGAGAASLARTPSADTGGARGRSVSKYSTARACVRSVCAEKGQLVAGNQAPACARFCAPHAAVCGPALLA